MFHSNSAFLSYLSLLPLPFLYGVVALLGLVVGSFLNVVIYRLPIMMMQAEENYIAETRNEPLPYSKTFNLWIPRSACPSCGKPIGAWQNIPLLSYLFQKAKCQHCQAPIPLHYPLVEIGSGLAALMAFSHFGLSWQAFAACLFLWILLVLTVIDAQTQLLPDQLTLPLIWSGLLANLFGLFTTLEGAVIGAIVGYLSLWSVFWLFKLIRGKEGMGYGDFKLMAAIGAWLGWQVLPHALLLSSLVGALYGITMLALKRLNSQTPFPFGPFIAGAGVILLFFNKQLPSLLTW